MPGGRKTTAAACGIQTPKEQGPVATVRQEQIRGSVARIERLAVHDGPGIRTVVFLKGCPLRCSWCSSPETQQREPELLFDHRRCLRCGACLAVCPAGAIRQANDGENCTDRSLCTGCGRCAAACPSGARRVVGATVTAAAIIREIEKDEVFYYRSGGGVTVSGGEPLHQPDFTREILKRCAARGIHTAMETSACAPWDRLAALIDFLDLVFVDVKHMDDALHRQFTGVGNRRILENLRKLAKTKKGPAVIVRVPVIPGVNDTGDNLRQTGALAKSLGRIRRVELLPYHRYGLHTYEALGRECVTGPVAAPSRERMHQLAALVGEQGIAVQVGG
jgi:pyruvate formate lyase activating enzyme